MFVYIFSIFHKRYRKYLKMCDVSWKECLGQNHSSYKYSSYQSSTRSCFSRCNNLSPRSPLSHFVIFDQINADVLFRTVNYLYLTTFTCPIVFLCPVSIWTVVNRVKKCSLRSTKVSTTKFVNDSVAISAKSKQVKNHLLWTFRFAQTPEHCFLFVCVCVYGRTVLAVCHSCGQAGLWC